MNDHSGAEKPQKIIAFDTAMSGCSVAYCDLEKNIFHGKTMKMARGQAEKLVPMIEAVMQESGADYSALDMIATTVGPGAFTGLRIGLSTARALGVALDVRVAGFTTLELLAYRFAEEKKQGESDGAAGDVDAVLVVLETKRQDFYVQIFSAEGGEITMPSALDFGDIAEILERKDLKRNNIAVIGDAAGRFLESAPRGLAQRLIHSNDFLLPDPADMARLLMAGHKPCAPDPVYLRGADVSKPKKKYRTIENHQ